MKRTHPLLFILPAFVLLRLLDILSAVEAFSWWEELERGGIGHDLVFGLKAPLMDYMPDGYSLGALLEGLLATPFFRALGPNLFALKLVALSISSATLVLVFLLLERHFSRKTAVLASLLYILAPPVYSRLTLICMGFHSDSVLFTMAVFLAFFEFLYGSRGRRPARAALFGLAAGLSVSYAYVCAVAILPCLVAWRLQDRRSFTPRLVLVFAAGLLAGLAPLLVHNALTGFEGASFAKDFFLIPLRPADGNLLHRVLTYPIKLARVVLLTAPCSLSFHDILGAPGRVLSCVYAALCLLVLIPFHGPRLKSGKLFAPDSKALPFLLYAATFLVLFAASNAPASASRGAPPIEYRYFAPFWLIGLCLIAVAAGARKTTSPAFVALLALGAIAHATLLFKNPFGGALRYYGYSYEQLGNSWAERAELRGGDRLKLDRLVELLRRFPQTETTFHCWAGAQDEKLLELAYGTTDRAKQLTPLLPPWCRVAYPESLGLFAASSSTRPLGEVLSKLSALAGEDIKIARLGAAQGFAVRCFQGEKIEAAAFLAGTRREPELQKSFLRTWGRLADMITYTNVNPAKVAAIREFTAHLRPEQRAWVWNGVGTNVAEAMIAFGEMSLVLDQALRHVPAESLGAFAHGLGWEMRRILIEDRARAYDWIGTLPSGLAGEARAGAAEFESWYRLPSSS